mmetsp:Transcript_16335/g.41866  ORF Transcript_16335/g.41866 Transcript_16335/m.41866 type:complete len:213 (+) Transcript_16335:868-1506(+)
MADRKMRHRIRGFQNDAQSSRTNSVPATGALKIAANPAAAPDAMKSSLSLSFLRNISHPVSNGKVMLFPCGTPAAMEPPRLTNTSEMPTNRPPPREHRVARKRTAIVLKRVSRGILTPLRCPFISATPVPTARGSRKAIRAAPMTTTTVESTTENVKPKAGDTEPMMRNLSLLAQNTVVSNTTAMNPTRRPTTMLKSHRINDLKLATFESLA